MKRVFWQFNVIYPAMNRTAWTFACEDFKIGQLSHAEPSRPSPWAHESAPDVSAIHMGRWFKHFKPKSWRSGIWLMQHGCMFPETLVIIGKKSSLERKEGNVSNMFFRLDCFIVSCLFHDCFMTVSFFFMCHDVSWCVMPISTLHRASPAPSSGPPPWPETRSAAWTMRQGIWLDDSRCKLTKLTKLTTTTYDKCNRQDMSS